MVRALTMLLALAGLIAAPAAAQAPDRWSPAIVEAYADGMIRAGMESYKVPGATIAVVKDGRLLLAKGYGIARIAPQRRADADTLFQIASISKTPVYIAIMQLVEGGKLKLDDPANAHLPPALRIPGAGFKKPVTLRHLMTHSAGFEDSALGHLFVNKPERLMPLDSYLARYRVRQVREAGLQTSYSNYALALLGAVIAHKSGMDFPTYMETRVLRPLGMTRATYREPYPVALGSQRGLPLPMDAAVAANITQQLGGETGKLKILGPEWTTMVAPAGGLRASANDMAAYLLALADPARLESAGVLKAASFATMLEPGISLPGTRRLGFMHYSFDGGRTGFGHGGAMAYGASDMIVVPELGLGVFVSTNGRGGFAFANDLVRRLLRDLAPLPPQAPVRAAETRAMAKEIAGAWVMNRRPWHRSERAIHLADAAFSVTAELDGDIVIAPFIGSAQRFQPMGKGEWQSVDRMSRRVFAKDGDGTPTLWSGSGTGSAVKAGLFARPLPMLATLVVTLIFASVAVWRGTRRLWQREDRDRTLRQAALATTAAAFAWTIGIGGFATMMAQAAPDEGTGLIFSYPGPLVWIAWTIALAIALTLGAIALSLRTRTAMGTGWSAWGKTKHVALLSLFILAAATAWQIGLAGYSGF